MRKLNKNGEKGGIRECRRIFLGIFVGICLSLLVAEHLKAGELGEPGKFIMSYVDKGLSILNDPALKNKPEERRIKVWDTVFSAFNLPRMCKSTLSSGEWKNVSEKNREEFTTLLTNVVKNAFLGKLNYFSGEKVEYLREIQGDKRAKVQCNVILNSGKKIIVDYSLLFENGNWLIYDVAVEGISVVNNYRRQFCSFLKTSSFDELLKKLRKMSSRNSENGFE
ncbi:MAG: MlaC/ttg2D family ABC transporter substrate-binding protein [Candidatus Anammoxibacter sp.]